MKVIILHGENILESYERLQKFIDSAKERSWEIYTIGSDTRSLPEVLSSESLFAKERLLIIEDTKVFTKKVLDWLKKRTKSIDATLIVYNKGVLGISFLKSLPGVTKVEEFTIPKHIWTLLDSFYPGNSKNLLLLLHALSPKEPLEFVFSLLAKTVRDLYWVKVDSKALSYPSWRITKLQRQSQRFSENLLTNIISDLAEIDIKVKTSEADLLSELDFLIITKLE
jgi:DNA polymerase III delta subunit